MSILVCDDLEDRCSETADRVRRLSGSEVDSIAGPHLREELKGFFARVDEQLWSSKKATEFDGVSPFDDYDLVILDNNLTHLRITGARLTAESIIGYVRAFSSALYIVSLNKNPDVDFDLRYLVGDYATRADLAVNFNHLEIKALWTGQSDKSADRFAPWYWQALLEAPTRRELQIKWVTEQRFDCPVLEALGFSDSNSAALLPIAIESLTPKTPLETIDGKGRAYDSITFLDLFLMKDRSLPTLEERRQIALAANEGDSLARKIVSRVVASDLEHWLRCDVLAPQETLVDLPHLLMRLPFLLGDNAAIVEYWNSTALSKRTDDGIDGLSDSAFDDRIVRFEFQHPVWALRRCFWWKDVEKDSALGKEFRNALKHDWADAVFCEDTSRFVLRVGGTNTPKEFVTQLEGSWERRYVEQLPDYTYAPKTRLAML